ncbi:DUF6448 family protein [Candidatus Solincola tengchongensis]|uniref:DUF6448 family protein n=1 Tax=Candidatus Solincola tengchongensis TaxID=2900693 RepID=UPI0025803C10|nr:DUF6448 family protein [Candidatus Solincola tengchongensis]
MDRGPVIPLAERAVERGDPIELIILILSSVEEELRKRFQTLMDARGHEEDDVPAARAYVRAMLGFELYAAHLFSFITGSEEGGEGS